MNISINPALTYTFLSEKLLLVSGGVKTHIIEDCGQINFLLPFLKHDEDGYMTPNTVYFSARGNSAHEGKLLERGILIDSVLLTKLALPAHERDYALRFSHLIDRQGLTHKNIEIRKLICRNLPSRLIALLGARYPIESYCDNEYETPYIYVEIGHQTTQKFQLIIYKVGDTSRVTHIAFRAHPVEMAIDFTQVFTEALCAHLLIHYIESLRLGTGGINTTSYPIADTDFYQKKRKVNVTNKVVIDCKSTYLGEANTNICGISATVKAIVRYGFGHAFDRQTQQFRRVTPSAGNLSSNVCYLVKFNIELQVGEVYLYGGHRSVFHKIRTISKEVFVAITQDINSTVLISVANIAALENKYGYKASMLAYSDAGASAYSVYVRANMAGFNCNIKEVSCYPEISGLLNLPASKSHIFVTSVMVIGGESVFSYSIAQQLSLLLKHRRSLRSLSTPAVLSTLAGRIESQVQETFLKHDDGQLQGVEMYRVLRRGSACCEITRVDCEGGGVKKVERDFIYCAINQHDLRDASLVYLFVPKQQILQIHNEQIFNQQRFWVGFAAMMYWIGAMRQGASGTLYGGFRLPMNTTSAVLSTHNVQCLALCLTK